MRNLIDDPETKKTVSLVNDLIKGLYLAGAPMKMWNQLASGSGGDIAGMEQASGNKYVKPLLGASLVADLLTAKNPNSKWSYGFDVIDGAPGGRINFRW